MKALIIFLISFNSHAYFMTEADFESCKSGSQYIFHVQKKNCEKHGKCVEIPSAACEIFDAHDELVNGKPLYSPKENVTACETPEACELLRPKLCKELESYEFFYTENLILSGFEAYCTKVTGYEQVKSGRKILKENATKKAEFLARLEAKRLEKEAEKSKEDKIQRKLREMAEAELAKEVP